MRQEPPARSQPLPEIDVTQLEPMARAQEAAGNLQAAAATWQRLIELWPQDDRVIAEFGSFHLRRGNFTEALAWYTQALALSDSNRGAHFGVSIALRAVGKLDDAILSVRRAIALNPGIGEYNSNLGHMLVSAGRSLEAIAAFEQAIALEPQNAGIHQALAALRLLDGDLETTIEQARAALSPDVASTHLRLGQLLIRGNRYVEAASALEEAVLIEPANVALRLTLADVYNELGRFESAVFELRQALRTARDRADIRLALSRTRERMGEVAAAVVVAADGPANDVLHPQRRRLQDIEAGHRHAVVPLRYFDATFEVLLGGEAITTTSPLVHTNLGDFDADFARHHAEVLYVERQRRCPAVRLYRLQPDARLIVSGDEDFTVVQGHRVVAEQVRPTATDALIEQAVNGPNRHDSFIGDCVLIGRYGICTWGHWLGELLPKIVAVECRHPGRFRYIVPRALVGNPLYRTALQSLHYYGIDTSRLAVALPDTSYVAEALYLVSPVWSPDRMVHPAAMESMRSAGSQSGDPAPGTRRIALLRRGDGGRGIANIAEVEAFFTARGWSIVDIEERTFQDQVALFRNAEAIACVLGSGLTGLIYAPPGVKILMLAPDKWSDLFFIALMQERGAHLADIRGRSLGANAAEAATAKFEVEIPAIEAGLAALGLAQPSTVSDVHRCLGNDTPLADVPFVVTIEHEAANVGDTINTIPFLLPSPGHTVVRSTSRVGSTRR